MGRRIATALTALIASVGLCAAGYGAYTGDGLPPAGPASARQGSIFGPWVMGGGPNSGK